MLAYDLQCISFDPRRLVLRCWMLHNKDIKNLETVLKGEVPYEDSSLS